MDHAVTWSSLFGVGFIVGGFLLACLAVLAAFASGMSDAPTVGNDASRATCILGLIGGAMLCLGVWMVI